MNERPPPLPSQKDEPSGPVASSKRGDRQPCLTEDEALNFVGGTSLGPPDAAVQRHLDECQACRVLVGEAARAMAEPRSEPEPIGPSTRDLPLTLSVGLVIMERFRIVRFVARGGMGEVYEAYALR